MGKAWGNYSGFVQIAGDGVGVVPERLATRRLSHRPNTGLVHAGQ